MGYTPIILFHDHQEKLADAEEGLEAASRLTEQLDKKEEALHALKDEGLSCFIDLAVAH